MFRRITLAAAMFAALIFGAQAQTGTTKAKSPLSAEVAQQIPDNTSNLVTPANVRQVFVDSIASAQQAPQVNAQVGTSYTFLASDYGNLVTFSNASATAVTLPQAVGSFSPWNVYVRNLGAGTVTITPQGGSLINGVTSLTVTTGGAMQIVSDGTNYQLASGLTSSSGIPAMAADTLICNPTASLASPQNCSSQQTQTILNLSQCINITSSAYGGAGNNTTDNTTPLNTALAALTSPGGCIYFPPGKYKFNSAITYNLPSGFFSASLIGSGQDNTILTWPNASGGMTFNYAGILSSVHMRDLALTTGTTAGGTAIALNYALANSTPGYNAPTDFYRVTIRGDDGYAVTDYWSVGLNIANVSNFNADSLFVQGPSAVNGVGINMVGLPASSAFAAVLNVSKSTFNLLSTGIVYGNFVQGITVDQTNFTGILNGIASAGSETGLAQLSVTNSQFNTGGTTSGHAILTATQIDNLQIVNNLFLVNGTTPCGLCLSISSMSTIASNVFWSSQGSVASATGISVPSSTIQTIVANNIFRSFNGSGAIAVSMGGGNSTIYGNSFSNNTTNISLAGSNNTVFSNPGYNPVGTSATATMGTSPFTVTAGASPETHYVFLGAGGTVSSITKGTRTIAATASTTAPTTIELGPGESYITTWATTAPTFVRDVH